MQRRRHGLGQLCLPNAAWAEECQHRWATVVAPNCTVKVHRCAVAMAAIAAITAAVAAVAFSTAALASASAGPTACSICLQGRRHRRHCRALANECPRQSCPEAVRLRADSAARRRGGGACLPRGPPPLGKDGPCDSLPVAAWVDKGHQHRPVPEHHPPARAERQGATS